MLIQGITELSPFMRQSQFHFAVIQSLAAEVKIPGVFRRQRSRERDKLRIAPLLF